MIRTLLSLAMLLLMLVTGVIALPNSCQASTQLEQTVSAQEMQEFRKLLTNYYAAWSLPDHQAWTIEMAEKFYQHNDRMFGFDFNPPAEGFQGWKAYKRELTKIMSNYSKFTVTLGDRFLVYRNGDVVWTVSTFNFSGALQNGSPIRGNGRNSLVWERIGNQWLISHEHISTPLIPSAS